MSSLATKADEATPAWWTEKGLLILGVVLLLVAGGLQAGLVELRSRYTHPVRSATARADLVGAGITALGSVRGLVATYLWMEVVDAQNRRDYVALRSTCDLLTRVQPNMTANYVFLARTQIEDIPDQMVRIQDRHFWVQEGLRTFQEGVARNPQESRLLFEMALTYSERFGGLRSDGAQLAELDAQKKDRDGKLAGLCPLQRSPGDAMLPRYGVRETMPGRKDVVLREPRCIENYFWSVMYAREALARKDVSRMRTWPLIVDDYKRIVWYSEWPRAKTNLDAAREAFIQMQVVEQEKKLPVDADASHVFIREYFYLLRKVLPRRVGSTAELQDLVAYEKQAWSWVQTYFKNRPLPEPMFASSAQAAQAYETFMQGILMEHNRVLPPSERLVHHEQLWR